MAVLFAACDRDLYYATQRDVDETGWNLAQTLPFDVVIEDTTQLYDVFIDLRVNVGYDKANAFLFVNTAFPDGSVAYDTLECPLADPEGRWYGRRTGRYVDNRYYLRHNVFFPHPGTYRFDITHGMRDTNVCGISSVGVIVKRVTINHEKK